VLFIPTPPRPLFHVSPLSADQPDIAHDPEARLVRGREAADCPLCQAGRCWQRLTPQRRRVVVLHGTMQA